MKNFLKIIATSFIVASIVINTAAATPLCQYENTKKVGLADPADKISTNSVFVGYINANKIQMKHVLKDTKNETLTKWSDGPDDYALILSAESLTFLTHRKNGILITSAVGTLEEAKTSCKAIMTKVVKWSTNTEISLLENQRHRNQFDYFITTKL